MRAKFWDGRCRQHRDAILASLALPDGDLVPLELQVLHAQRKSLEQSKAAAVEQRRDQPRHAAQLVEQPPHFGTGEDDGEVRWSADAGE